MEKTTMSKTITDLIKETERLKRAVSDRERFIARLISNDFREKFQEDLPLGASFLLDLEIKGLTGITTVEYLSYHEIQAFKRPKYSHEIIELVLDLPENHLLRVTPMSQIKNGIALINEKTDLNITDTFGLIGSPRINKNNKEYLNPKIKSFNLKGHFNLEKYINC